MVETLPEWNPETEWTRVKSWLETLIYLYIHRSDRGRMNGCISERQCSRTKPGEMMTLFQCSLLVIVTSHSSTDEWQMPRESVYRLLVHYLRAKWLIMGKSTALACISCISTESSMMKLQWIWHSFVIRPTEAYGDKSARVGINGENESCLFWGSRSEAPWPWYCLLVKHPGGLAPNHGSVRGFDGMICNI